MNGRVCGDGWLSRRVGGLDGCLNERRVGERTDGRIVKARFAILYYCNFLDSVNCHI